MTGGEKLLELVNDQDPVLLPAGDLVKRRDHPVKRLDRLVPGSEVAQALTASVDPDARKWTVYDVPAVATKG